MHAMHSLHQTEMPTLGQRERERERERELADRRKGQTEARSAGGLAGTPYKYVFACTFLLLLLLLLLLMHKLSNIFLPAPENAPPKKSTRKCRIQTYIARQ